MSKIEVFSSGPQCGYCTQAKQLLADNGFSYVELDIVSDEAHRDELVKRLPRARAMPQIFVDGKHIGSTEDLEVLVSSGELQKLAGE